MIHSNTSQDTHCAFFFLLLLFDLSTLKLRPPPPIIATTIVSSTFLGTHYIIHTHTCNQSHHCSYSFKVIFYPPIYFISYYHVAYAYTILVGGKLVGIVVVVVVFIYLPVYLPTYSFLHHHLTFSPLFLLILSCCWCKCV